MKIYSRFTPTTGRLPLAAALASCALFTAGCANMQTTASDANTLGSASGMLQGSIHGGNQPVGFSTVTLYSVSQTGQGTAGVTLATTTSTATGGFQFQQLATPTGGPNVPTALGGNQYECGTGTDPLLYIIARGGNTQGSGGSAINNSASAFIAPVGYCTTASTQFVNVTEVTTAAMVAATAQFMNPATEMIGADGITVAAVAVGHAFGTVNTLVNQATGFANTTQAKTTTNLTNLSGGPYYVDGVTVTATPEAAKLNTVANILSACINQTSATSGSNCTTLFTNAVPPVASHTALPSATYNQATDTIQAALYMFENPTDGSMAARTNLYNLAPAAAPFQPTLTSVPTDWTLGVTYTSINNCGNASHNSLFFSKPTGLSVDGNGNIWIANVQSNYSSLAALNSTGSPFGCITLGVGTLATTRSSTAVDDAGNIYFGDNYYSALYRFNPNTGAVLQFNTANAAAPRAIAADGADGIFFTGVVGGTGRLFRIAAAATSTTAGAPVEVSNNLGTTPDSIFPDTANDMWVASGGAYVTQVASSTTGTQVENSYNTTNFPVSGPANSLVVGPSNAVYVATGDTADVLTILVAGTTYTVKTGFPTAPNLAGEVTPRGIYLDGAKNSWITDGATEGTSGNYALSVIGADGAAISATGSGLQKSSAYLNNPHAIVVDPSGNVWIANDNNTTGITELVGAAAPIYQPYARAIQISGGYYFQNVP